MGNGMQRDAAPLFISAITAYRNAAPPFNDDLAEGTTAEEWWWSRAANHDGVSQVVNLAVLLLHVTPHTADLERAFSTMGYNDSGKRNRLSVNANADLTTIRTHFQQLQSGDAEQRRTVQELSGAPLAATEADALQVRRLRMCWWCARCAAHAVVLDACAAVLVGQPLAQP